MHAKLSINGRCMLLGLTIHTCLHSSFVCARKKDLDKTAYMYRLVIVFVACMVDEY